MMSGRPGQDTRVAVVIVAFRNPQDVVACVSALANSAAQPVFDIFVCENGGANSFQELCSALSTPQGPCCAIETHLSLLPRYSPKRLSSVSCYNLKHRAAHVWIGCASHNLGYAGGVNVWVDELVRSSNYSGFWILNPDTQPHSEALAALVERALTGHKGMVGSTIVEHGQNSLRCRAGHHWRRLRTSLRLIGLDEIVDAPIDLQAIETALDCISGASMYITRACRDQIGPMDERFFLFYEDADWSFRAKKFGLGYAPASIVPHRGGTTIGSAKLRAERSELSAYLESRNHLHFVRMYWPRYYPLALIFGCAQAALYLLVGAPHNAIAAARGMLAGIRGEKGVPKFHT